MERVYIFSMDAVGQYDKYGNQIAEWNDKQCSWVVCKEYNNYELVYHEDENGISDLPRACYESELPNLDGYPDIELKIKYDDHGRTYYNSKYWGDGDYTEEEAIEHYGERYLMWCDGEGYKNVILQLYYNDKLIWDYTNLSSISKEL